MLLSFFKPAFALFQRLPTARSFLLFCGAISLAYLTTLAWFLLMGAQSSLTFLIGSALFAFGLYIQLARTVIYWYAHSATYRRLNRVAAGDLRLQFLPGWGKFEGQGSWTELNRMNKVFPRMIQGIRDSAQRIQHGSHEVALGYVSLSQGTEHQATTLQDSKRLLEEIALTVADNAENCRQAERVVSDVGRSAKETGDAMRQVTLTMGRIEASTRKVVEFVGIVQNISLQTNILALNAAVEAARAGAQGEGFAVVAAEVRDLAHRSAEATAKIKALITSSSDRVFEGSALVAEAERAFDAAVAQVSQVMALISSIAVASTQQSGGVQSVAQAIPQLETVTEESAALVQEGARAAQSFEQTAGRLVEATRAFLLPEKKQADEAITVGSFDTLRRNIGLGRWMALFTFFPMAINSSIPGITAALLCGLPLLGGVIMTFLAALGAAEAAGGTLSAVVSVALQVLAVFAFLGGVYLFFALTVWQTVTAIWMETTVKRLTSGDLTWEVHLSGTEETSGHIEAYRIGRAMYDIKHNFIKVVREVRASAESIAAEARGVAEGYDKLSSRTLALAAAIEESAASIDELKATVKQNAASCQFADVAAEEVRQRAEQAADAMQRVTSTMDGIEQSAREMTEFVGVIESIAFQTNILALNAAVEAARAGEQGRGFAVVSAEVRALAQRSAQATVEVKDLIADSVRFVAEGVELVKEAQATLNRVVSGVHQVVALIRAIAAASVEQTHGMQQVSVALTELEGVAQQNAALVEEGAAVSVSFAEEAAALTESVSVFRVEKKKKSDDSKKR